MFSINLLIVFGVLFQGIWKIQSVKFKRNFDGMGYEKLMGQQSIYKYCGERDDYCMFTNQCCEDFICDPIESICKLPIAISGDGKVKNKCLNNMDCPQNECCRRITDTASVCGNDCSPEKEVISHLSNPSYMWKTWWKKRRY